MRTGRLGPSTHARGDADSVVDVEVDAAEGMAFADTGIDTVGAIPMVGTVVTVGNSTGAEAVKKLTTLQPPTSTRSIETTDQIARHERRG